MDKAVLSAQTSQLIERTIARQPHAILISGKPGSGRLFIARLIAGQLGTKQGDIAIISSENETKKIGIDEARNLQHIYKLKTDSGSKRTVIIEDAQRLSTEGQNSLLKLIEEPPAGVLFIFTTTSPDAVLPTIKSRCSSIELGKPDKAAVEKRILEKFDTQGQFESFYAMSDGRIGEITKLATDKTYAKNRKQQLALAKQFISAKGLERLVLSLDAGKSADSARLLLEDCLLVLSLSLSRATQKPDYLSAVVHNMKLLGKAIDAISINSQPKLQIDCVIASWR